MHKAFQVWRDKRHATACPPGSVLALVAGLALAGCAASTKPPLDYPALQPLDQLLAEADNAFSGPIP